MDDANPFHAISMTHFQIISQKRTNLFRLKSMQIQNIRHGILKNSRREILDQSFHKNLIRAGE